MHLQHSKNDCACKGKGCSITKAIVPILKRADAKIAIKYVNYNIYIYEHTIVLSMNQEGGNCPYGELYPQL